MLFWSQELFAPGEPFDGSQSPEEPPAASFLETSQDSLGWQGVKRSKSAKCPHPAWPDSVPFVPLLSPSRLKVVAHWTWHPNSKDVPQS